MKHYEAVVVGCGAMGSAVSYHLASRGVRSLTLDRFEPGTDRGSSHGTTRIIRTAYYEDPRYVPLLTRAFELWSDLQRESGSKLVEMTGGLMVGPPDGELIPGVLRTVAAHSLEHREMTGREVTEEFRAFKPDEGVSVVFEKGAGILFADRCIRAHVRLAEEKGASFSFGERVSEWKSTSEGVRVTTQKDEYLADRVVAAAGPWMAELFAPGFALTCERQVPFWFDPSPGRENDHKPDKMPIFMWEEPGRRYFYGIPDVGEGVKAAAHHQGATVNPDSVDREVHDSDKAPVAEFVRRTLPGLKSAPSSWTTCIYTNTEDGNFVIDAHPADPRVVVVSACSGHGFKLSGVLGETAARMAAGERVPEVEFLRAGRLVRPAER